MRGQRAQSPCGREAGTRLQFCRASLVKAARDGRRRGREDPDPAPDVCRRAVGDLEYAARASCACDGE